MTLTFIPLTYGSVRKNASVLDALTAAKTAEEATASAVAFLKLGAPDATEEDFDSMTPGAIQAAASDLYRATFARPEAAAPVQPIP